MAKQVLGPGTRVTINAVDLSDHVSQVTIEDSAEDVDVTGFGEAYREHDFGLKEATITATFFQDYGAASVDATLSPMYYNRTAGTVKVTPDTSGTVVYTMVAKLFGWSPVSGGVGDANTIDATFQNWGTAGLTRGTA